MSERRSGRSKTAINYAKLAETSDNDDDFEEFKAQPMKKAKVDSKEKDEKSEKEAPKTKKVVPETKAVNSDEKAQSINARISLEDKVLQRQLKQAIEVSKTDAMNNGIKNDDTKQEDGNNSSKENDSSEDEFKPTNKKVKKIVPIEKETENVVECKVKEVTKGSIDDPVDTNSSQERTKFVDLTIKKDEDIKNESMESEHSDGRPLDEESSESSEESSGEPSDESSSQSSDGNSSDDKEFEPVKEQVKKETSTNKKANSPVKRKPTIPKKDTKTNGESSDESSSSSSDANSSEDEEFEPAKKQAKKETSTNKKAKGPVKRKPTIPKKETNGNVAPSSKAKSPAVKPNVKTVEEHKKDIPVPAEKLLKENLISAKQPSISDSTAKRKGPSNLNSAAVKKSAPSVMKNSPVIISKSPVVVSKSPAVISKSSAVVSRSPTGLPAKGIRIGLSRKVHRKPLHASVKPPT